MKKKVFIILRVDIPQKKQWKINWLCDIFICWMKIIFWYLSVLNWSFIVNSQQWGSTLDINFQSEILLSCAGSSVNSTRTPPTEETLLRSLILQLIFSSIFISIQPIQALKKCPKCHCKKNVLPRIDQPLPSYTVGQERRLY